MNASRSVGLALRWCSSSWRRSKRTLGAAPTKFVTTKFVTASAKKALTLIHLHQPASSATRRGGLDATVRRRADSVRAWSAGSGAALSFSGEDIAEPSEDAKVVKGEFYCERPPQLPQTGLDAFLFEVTAFMRLYRKKIAKNRVATN